MRYPVAIHGGGRALGMLREEFDRHSEVSFHGPYDYRNVPGVYSTLDLVWASYPAEDRNVKLAISNKFFESILFGVPGVFSQGTKLGQMVESLGIGFSLDPYDASAIRSWLSRLQADLGWYAGVRSRLLDHRREMENKLTWREQDRLIVDLLDKTLTRGTAA